VPLNINYILLSGISCDPQMSQCKKQKYVNGGVEWNRFDNQITLQVSCKMVYFVL